MPKFPLTHRLRAVAGRPFRTAMVRSRRRFLQAAEHSCRETQRQTLQRLLRLNSGSRFFRDYGLRESLTIDEFRSALPICDYDTFHPYIEQMRQGRHSALLGRHNQLLMYALTSGTTSASKYIPVTSEFLKCYRRGWQHWGITVHEQNPRLKLLRMVQLTSGHRLSLAPDGTPQGSISGLVTAMQSPIVRRMYSIPAAVAGIRGPTARRYAQVRFALEDPWVGMLVTANPATLLQISEFADAHAEELIRDIRNGSLQGTPAEITSSESKALSRWLRPNLQRSQDLERIIGESGSLKPTACWPELQCLGVWTGGSAAAYLPELRDRFGSVPLHDHGLHASEGRMTIPLTPGTSAGLPDITSHFFEFLPAESVTATDGISSGQKEPAALLDLPPHDVAYGRTLLADELETGREYFVLMTTASGLYRYNIRDVVRCTGFYGSSPLLEFLHKGAHVSSITGEKISESQVVTSVTRAAAECDLSVSLFTLTPRWG
ncbi:MAG: GH3 auxin-responsive promoter family protein, partial [Planctomycetaceae bacterium]|nr:GH3 auxin-responsive promoter family protein [Planctomycetaceae bacterium]